MPSAEVRRRRFAAIGIGVLAIATLVLSILALTQNRGGSESEGATPVPSFTAEVPSPTEPSATESASAKPPGPAAATVPPTRLLAAANADRVYRASAGACPSPRTVFEFSNDGGVTWQGGDAAGTTDSTAALALSIGGPDLVQMVTLATDGCEPQMIRSFVSGIDWEVFNADLGGTWYFNPARADVVHTSEGEKAAPCAAVALAGAGSRGAVLCGDATVVTTTDAGATWAEPVAVPGVAAVATRGDGFVLAVLNANGCVGVQVVGLTGGALGAPGACLAATAAAGEVAVATASDDSVFVWAGNTVARSADGGATW